MSLKPLNFLWSKFLDKYPDNPKWNSILGQFVYLRTYSRFNQAKVAVSIGKKPVNELLNTA